MTTYTRAQWGARPARPGPGPLYGADVIGMVVHWPAMTAPIRGVAAVMRALRSWQAYHMDDRGWSDIAYQVAVDQDGNRYLLRGLDTQSAANGDTDVNDEYGAILLVLAPGEQPSPAMVAEVRRVMVDHRRLFPRSTLILGHSQVRPEPTQCPGPVVLDHIALGAFEPVPPRPPIRRTLRKVTIAVKQATADGYTGVAEALKRVHARARGKHQP